VHYLSTRKTAPAVVVAAAMEAGLAPDGGLYVPEKLPRFSEEFPSGVPDRLLNPEALPELAARVLAPFFRGDALSDDLPAICKGAFSFPIPLVEVTARGSGKTAAFLELFHGPTAAFKDVGARFLAECFARQDDRPRTILVATSGDTGGAVASAFWRRPRFEVVILFPKGGVSPEQEQQLTCWGENVHAFAVRGTFDDCQGMLKTALARPGSLGSRRLTTANSINIARLLPQIVYYADAGLRYHRAHGCAPTFVVPAGNVGNATAALWAKWIGFPVRHVVMVTNRTRTVPDYLETGSWRPRPAVQTLANAMDVGDPSNMERVFHLYPTIESLQADVSAFAVDDASIRRTIASGHERWGRTFDPHTATAVHVVETQAPSSPVIVATAHPAKFQSIVEPMIGRAVEVPDSLARIRQRPSRFVEIAASVEALGEALA